MSTAEANLSTDTTPPSLTPGQQLRARREALQLSTADVAEGLRLPEDYILYIETDDYAAINSRIFARGYLVNYARFVNLSETEILGAFDLIGFVEKKTPCNTSPIDIVAADHPGTAHKKRWLAYGGAMMLILLVMTWTRYHETTIPANNLTPHSLFEGQTLSPAPTSEAHNE